MWSINRRRSFSFFIRLCTSNGVYKVHSDVTWLQHLSCLITVCLHVCNNVYDRLQKRSQTKGPTRKERKKGILQRWPRQLCSRYRSVLGEFALTAAHSPSKTRWPDNHFPTEISDVVTASGWPSGACQCQHKREMPNKFCIGTLEI